MMYHINMDGYISDFSAAIMWDISCIEAVIGNRTTEPNATEFTVTKYNARFRNNGKKVHSTEQALPPGAVTTRNGMTIVSPELLFLQLSGKLSIHRLILLGLQLCSHRPGFPSEAITTKQKLDAFLEKTRGHWGQHKAKRAIKYV